MIGRPSGHRRHHSGKPHGDQIEFVDEDLDDADRIVLSNVVVQTIGKQCRLPAILALDETLRPDLR